MPPRIHSVAGCLAVLLAAATIGAAPPVDAADRRPLLQEGKTTLFQRVLVRPQAKLFQAPEGAPQDEKPRAFDIFYVYDRQQAGGSGWVEVGRSTDGDVRGWLRAEKTIDWKQTIVVTFSNPAGRERSLLFDRRESIEAILNSEDLVGQLQELRRQAVGGSLPQDSPIISIEPETYVDIGEQFYILPILDHELTLNPLDYSEFTLLKVASVPEEFEPARETVSAEDALKDFKVGIVFVVDTTKSMGPYIDRTRETVLAIHDRIAGSEIGHRVSFGLVGFRDSTDLVPGLEYIARSFVALEPDQETDALRTGLAGVEEAAVSSSGFNEDAYAGMAKAIRETDWDPFGGRYVVLVTDAGPRPANDENVLVRVDAAGLNDEAREKSIGIYAIHLRTPAGAGTHVYAENTYRDLSVSLSDGQPRYYPIAAGDPQAFQETVSVVTEQLVTAIESAMQGTLQEAEAEAASSLEDALALDTLAMQLAYLGRRQEERAPDVFEAWLAERDLENPTRTAVEVRLLLTKNQLSTLRDVLARIVEAGETARSTSGADFFEEIKSALAILSHDPNRLVDVEFETLGGAMGEFFEDLPYRSEIMQMKADRWVEMSAQDQRMLIDRLHTKLSQFERIHDDPALWTSLYEGSPPGETVYPLPLSRLP